ncbi:MAG: RlmE family RNA methyltransferase [Deltaproteobacteria bacterium]|nr:RlmE family RNA methyltransferase [Deltaproteobacteria bacterium]MBW2072818.1 RlmE family RNA methyltransferase [Deltaproteobacteria bacterium]
MGKWQPHDHFFQRAKRQGFVARSVYKLEEVDRRVGLLKPGYKVLDLGCYPGSWLQYCSRAVGKNGLVVGVDIQPVDISLPTNVHIIACDVFNLLPTDLFRYSSTFDVVLSDLAPATTGIRSVDSARSAMLVEKALALAASLLQPGGHFVAKIFQGSELDVLNKKLRTMFERVRGIRPRAVRKGSRELYLVALGKRQASSDLPEQ